MTAAMSAARCGAAAAAVPSTSDDRSFPDAPTVTLGHPLER